MSVTTVSFHKSTLPSETYIASLGDSDGPPYTVHGVALGAGDVTQGASGIKKKWPASELEKAAETLEETNLVVDHENNADGVVGRVTKAGYKKGTGVVYQAELYEEDLAGKIENNLLEVSIRGYHADVDNLEEDDDTEALIVEDITFDNLSIVPKGASPSNTLEMGEHEELTFAELQSFTASLMEEAEPGMWVEDGEMKGITIGQPEDGEIEVDIYEESDGQWRSTRETQMMSVNDLSEWDVEESDIGPVEEEDESEEENVDPPEWEEGDMVQWQVNPDMKGKIVHVPSNQEIVMVEVMNDGEPTGYTLSAGYTDIVEVDNEEENGRSNHENYDVEEDDWAQWYPSEQSEEHGFVLDVDDSGDEAIVTIEVWTQNSDGEWETDGEEITKPMEDVEPWGNFPREQEEFADAIDGEDPRRAVKPSEEENTQSDELVSSEVEKGLKEKVEKHNEEHGDDDSKRVTYRMLKNVFERGMGAYQDSHREGMTAQQWSYARVNAFLYLLRNGNPENDSYTQDNDLLPDEHQRAGETGDSEENALTTSDVITDVVYGKHDPMGSDEEKTPQEIVEQAVVANLESDMDELDEVYSEWDDHVNMSASELKKWSSNPCSRQASVEPVTVIKRNLELLEANKSDWDEGHIEDAKRTISFISRMRGAKGDGDQKTGGSYDCPTDWAVSLLNWAYNPFDSVPSAPDNDELDSVDTVELSDETSEPLINSLEDYIDMMEGSPERFTEHEVERKRDELATDEGETHDGEASDVASLAEYEMHEVSYEGTHENEWNRPTLEDFVKEMGIDDDISEYDDLTNEAKEDVASAFIISASGFPADDYGDLNLPVVEPSGELSVNALSAVKGGRGASAVEGLSSDMEDEIDNYVNQLASEEFDRNWSDGEENMSKHENEEDDSEMMGGDVPDDHMFESESDAEDKAEDMGISGAHEMDGMWVPGSSHEDYMEAVEEMTEEQADEDGGQNLMVTMPVQTSSDKISITNMSNLQEELSDLDDPVAVEAEELEALEQKADRLDTMSESLEELRERTDILDEVDQDALEELQESEDPMVVESSEYEELESEAQQVKGVYASALADEYEAFTEEELSANYSTEELREKFEDVVGDVEEELTATGSEQAEPKSQDPSEEELAEDTEEEELADEVAAKQAEIKEKILSGD